MGGGLVLPPGMNQQQPVVLSTPMNDMQVISLMAAVLHQPDGEIAAEVGTALMIMAEAINQIQQGRAAAVMQMRAAAQGPQGRQ
jgi:hypothetical protein